MAFDFLLACPHCGQKQALNFKDQVVWKGGATATREEIELTARIKCFFCGGFWTNDQRRAAVSAGEAHPRKEIVSISSVAYQLHRLNSLFKGGDLVNMITRWNKAQKDYLDLQNVINSVFGEPWKEVVRSSEKIPIKERKCGLPPKLAPQGTLCLTAGFDMQKHGFWFSVWAHKYEGVNLHSYMIWDGFVQTFSQVADIVFEEIFEKLSTKGYVEDVDDVFGKDAFVKMIKNRRTGVLKRFKVAFVDGCLVEPESVKQASQADKDFEETW